MQALTDAQDVKPEERETWILEALERDPLPVREIAALAVADTARTREWLQLLVEAVAGRGMAADLVSLLTRYGRLLAGGADCAGFCRDALKQGLKTRMQQAFLKASGMAEGVGVDEALRRLQTLMGLAPGVLCHDRTWGFGVVKGIDDFYEKVTIDFDGKRGHQMTFAYAGETLALIPADHLLALRHRDPAALARRVQDDPAGVVRVALASFGPVSVNRLKELLVDDVLPESDWKRFWDAARKELKDDPLIDIPAKRTEPIVVRERAQAYDQAWYARLATERDVKTIIELAGAWCDAGADRTAAATDAATVRERLVFAGVAVEDNDPATAARVLRLLRAGGGLGEVPGFGAATFLVRPERLRRAIEGLPAREGLLFLSLVAGQEPGRVADILLAQLPEYSAAALQVAAAWLTEQARSEPLAGTMRQAFLDRVATVAYVAWCCRNRENAFAWTILTPRELLGEAIRVIGQRLSHDALRAQKMVLACLEDRAWLEAVLQMLTPAQRAGVFADVRVSRDLDSGESRALLARMVRLFPELQEVLQTAEAPAAPAAATVGGGRLTSWRMLRERQEQLRRLVEVEIPDNSREIGHARSYGDLRENFEYQTAKDRQRLLMQRQAEMEEDLKQMRGTDFAGLPADVAGMGTCVTIVRPDGASEVYNILGEWDRDEALGIIANASLLAKRLAGQRAGDEVRLPQRGMETADAEETCRIGSVVPISETVRAWANGRAAGNP